MADSTEQDSREERIGELINDFLDRRGRGDAISEEDFLRLHPGFATDLREHFESLQLIQNLSGAPSSEATLPAGKPFRPAGSSAGPQASSDGSRLPVVPGYDVMKQIGRGGMGVVFKAVQLSTKRLVALKLLLEGPFASPTARHRFEREIALAAQLRHANIIPIYDSGESDGRMYYAMEHVYGLPLLDYVRANKPGLKEVLRLFAKICDAVSHAHHRGVVHRDLKPTNILVDGEGEPHVLDFGLAKAGGLGDMNLSMTAQIVGTPAYMSPEQAAGDPGGIDTRTDVYSLGIMLYEMLTGKLPYETTGAIGQTLHNIAHAEPERPRRIDPSIDEDLEAVILKAIEKGKENRYQSAPSLQQDIENFLADQPLSVRPASGLAMLRKNMRRHRVAIGIVAALFIAAAGTFLLVRGSIHTRELEQKLAAQDQQVQTLTEDKERLSDEREATRQANEEALDFMLAKLFNMSAVDRRNVIIASRELGPTMRVNDLLLMIPRVLAMGWTGDGAGPPVTTQPAVADKSSGEPLIDPAAYQRFLDALGRAADKSLLPKPPSSRVETPRLEKKEAAASQP